MTYSNHKIHPVSGNTERWDLYWLDADICVTDDNRRTKELLSSVTPSLRTFNNIKDCQEQIESLAESHSIVLIVSGRLGSEIVPKIHSNRHILSIYVYCMDKALNEEWAKQYRKIKEVIVYKDYLISRMKFDQRPVAPTNEILHFNIYSLLLNPDPGTLGLNENFVHTVLLMDCLLRLNVRVNDKRKMISLCQRELKSDKNQLVGIHEFEREYTPHTSVLWYMHDTFIHRLLNKALQNQNLEQLLSFHILLHDMHEQMTQNPLKSSIRVYHGQIMSNDELQYIEQSLKGYLSNYSFLLASINRDRILSQLKTTITSSVQNRVLFIIDIEPDIVSSKPFMDISKLNSSINETQILFMVGCIFRLIQVDDDGDFILIRMTLCGVNDASLKFLYDKLNVIRDYIDENNEINLRSFADIASHLKQYSLAIQIYHGMLNELSSNDSSYADLCRSLGNVYKENNDCKQSRNYYRKALKTFKVVTSSDMIHAAILNGAIGDTYYREKNPDKALEFYETACHELQKGNARFDPHMANFLSNIAGIYKQKSDYSAALRFYQEALDIDKKNSSANSLNVAKSHNNIAIVHGLLQQYDQALQSFQQALSIRLSYYAEEHSSIAEIFANIGFLYESQSDFRQAVHFYKKAAKIYHLLYPTNHEVVIKIDNTVKQVLNKLK